MFDKPTIEEIRKHAFDFVRSYQFDPGPLVSDQIGTKVIGMDDDLIGMLEGRVMVNEKGIIPRLEDALYTLAFRISWLCSSNGDHEEIYYLFGLMKAWQTALSPECQRLIWSRAKSQDMKENLLCHGEDRFDSRNMMVEVIQFYEAGNREMHHKLARKMADKYRLPYASTKQKIKPIARRFGCVFGDPANK